LIPAQIVSIFDSKELELLISGLPDIDSKHILILNKILFLINLILLSVQDLKENTEYSNYTPKSPVITWLWEVLE
jgi:E3 ubiquitin-protein ligase HUWE1